MSYSEVEICNIALARIGIDRAIASLSEQSKEARNCARFYPLARDETLERVPWPFAVKTAALALIGDNTLNNLLPGYGYSYQLPADALTVLEVLPAAGVTTAIGYYTNCACDAPWMPCRASMYDFRKALSTDGLSQVILAGISDAYAVYVARVTNTALFSTQLVSLIADRLAMELSMPMTADPKWFPLVQQRYLATFADAASRQFEQQGRGVTGDAPAIRARS